MQWLFVGILIIIGSAWCQNEIPIDLQDIEKSIGEIPGLKNFNQSAMPSIEEVQEAIEKKCEKNGGPEAFEKLEIAKDEIQECIESNFNFTQIQEELDEKRKTGSMEEVFAKYCLKMPIIQQCMVNLTSAIEPCLEEEEKSSLKLILNITESLASFACFKEGDRIAMFVAEGGFECLQAKQDGLEQCANETFSHRLTSDISLTNLPLFVIDKDGCNDYLKFQACTVRVLETCDDNTPANIIDALFKFVRRITPCKNQSTPTSALGTSRRVVRSAPNQNELDKLLHTYDQMRLRYEPHCLKYGGQKAADELREALVEVEKCQNLVQTNFMRASQPANQISFDYLCKDYRAGLRGCLVDLTRKLEACSGPEEKYVPKLGLDIYDSVFKFHCKDDAKALKKVLGEQDLCMKRVINSTDSCVAKTEYIKDLTKKSVVTKSELCGDLKRLKNCFVDISAQQCPNNANVNELTVGYADAIYAPCAGCQILTNFMMVSLLLILSKFL